MEEESRLRVRCEQEASMRGYGDRVARLVDRLIKRWLFHIPAPFRARFIRDLHRLRAVLVFFSSVDPLTGLTNRRAGWEQLVKALGASRAPGIGLIYLDINSFKAINDTFGHAGGDAVLRALGSMLRHLVRENDLSIRMGGEEVLLVFLSTNTWKDFNAALKRILSSLHDPEYQTQHGSALEQPFATAAGGVWIEWETRQNRRPFAVRLASSLMAHADRLMYQSKLQYKDTRKLCFPVDSMRLIEGEPKTVASTEVIL